MSGSVRIHEVSLRDGLQNEPEVLSTEDKLSVLNALVRAGFSDIEVTSFVRPRWVPQLADAAELVRRLPQVEGVRFWALVPNARGLDRALEVGMGQIATFLSASESHNLKNLNRTITESVASLKTVIGTAVHEGVQVRSYISTVFGCPYEGDVAVERTLEIAHALTDAGADIIALGDTTGMAQPEQVKQVLARLVESGIDLDRIALHFHDTRGTALANLYAAWQFGARHFDAATAGVGGCPYAPGAAGNVATEDVVNLFAELGCPTGVDLDAACEAGGVLEGVLGRPLPGRYHRFWKGASNPGKKARSA